MNRYYMGGFPKNYSGGGYIDKKNVMSSDKNRLKAIQLDLKSKGFYTGRIDGIYGPLTAKAVDSYNYDVDLRNPAKENAIYGQKTSGAPYFQNMARESTNIAQFPQMQGGSDWAPSSVNMMDTYGVYGNSNTVGKDYVELGRQSVNTTSPRGLEESGKTILSMGSRGQEVRELQKLLKEKGYYRDSIDGKFGQKTKEAVKAFQKDFNKNPNMLAQYTQDNKTYAIGRNWDSPTGYKYKPMIIDGIVGDQTRAALMAEDLGPKPRMGNPWENMSSQNNTVSDLGVVNRNYNVSDNRVMGQGDFFNLEAANALNGLMTAISLSPFAVGEGAIIGGLEGGMGRVAAERMLGEGAKQLGTGVPRLMPGTLRLPSGQLGLPPGTLRLPPGQPRIPGGFYGGGYIPFTNGGSLNNGREKVYLDGYAYGGSMYNLPQNIRSYAEGGLVEQRMAESSMMREMAANILAGKSNNAPTSAAPMAAPPAQFDFVTQQPMQVDAPITPQQPVSKGQQDINAILALPYKERRIAHHNPGNIKYGKFAAKYGAVAGRKATDGGNIAIFPDWESGMKAKKDLLRSGGYKNLTLDEAMKRWSGYYVEPKPGKPRGGYGADRIAPQLANKRMADMSEDELNLVMKKMAKIEDGDVYKVVYGKAMGGELPKGYFSGGTMEIASAALGQIANMAGRVQDIANPVADPTKGDYKFNWGDALNPTKGGILMELAKKMSMDNARSKYVMGASPGNYADGGEIMNMINPSNGIDMLNQPAAVRAMLTGNTNQPMKMGGVMNYASGGDMKLSTSSFLVNGNPSVTDGNFYPQLNAKLDHGEVVKDNFVFSNKLRDPQTNVTYAKLAQPIEKSTGKAEKFMQRFQNDVFSKNTVTQNNKFLDSLSNKQEVLATAMGLRGNDSTRTFASGGPADPYLPYGPFSKNIFQLANAFKTNPVQPLTPNQLQQQYAALSLDPFLNATQNPSASNTNTQGSTNTTWAFGPVTAQQRQDAAMSPIRGSQAAYDAQKRTPYKFDPNNPYEQYMFHQDQLAMDQQMLTPGIEMATDPTTFGTELQNVGANLSGDPIWTPSVSLDDQLKGKSVSKTNSDKFGQKWTVGDYLNAAAVAGRFGQLIGGPEVEKPVYDTTAITRQVYDPASALYQSNRQTSGMLNRMDVPSINARTSIANNMLAQRLNQDAQTLSSYQNMNAQGLRDYETRATEQRRYNVGQTLATNQMNAQNRAAYKQAVDNAMTSLGNFGTAMNEKEQSYDTLNILKTMYPEVYRRIMSGQKVTLADSEAAKTVQDATGNTTAAPAAGSTNASGGATTTPVTSAPSAPTNSTSPVSAPPQVPVPTTPPTGGIDQNTIDNWLANTEDVVDPTLLFDNGQVPGVSGYTLRKFLSTKYKDSYPTDKIPVDYNDFVYVGNAKNNEGEVYYNYKTKKYFLKSDVTVPYDANYSGQAYGGKLMNYALGGKMKKTGRYGR